MKIEFLGHGIFEEQDNTVGNYRLILFNTAFFIIFEV